MKIKETLTNDGGRCDCWSTLIDHQTPSQSMELNTSVFTLVGLVRAVTGDPVWVADKEEIGRNFEGSAPSHGRTLMYDVYDPRHALVRVSSRLKELERCGYEPGLCRVDPSLPIGQVWCCRRVPLPAGTMGWPQWSVEEVIDIVRHRPHEVTLATPGYSYEDIPRAPALWVDGAYCGHVRADGLTRAESYERDGVQWAVVVPRPLFEGDCGYVMYRPQEAMPGQVLRLDGVDAHLDTLRTHPDVGGAVVYSPYAYEGRVRRYGPDIAATGDLPSDPDLTTVRCTHHYWREEGPAGEGGGLVDETTW